VYDEELMSLEEGLRRLKIEYHVFFNGNRKKPPEDLRLRLERLVKKLSECSNMSSSQRFRFTTLVTRFYVYRDLWRRTLREQEMGTDIQGEPKRKSHISPQSLPSSPEAAKISLSDPKSEKDKVRFLYDAVLRLKKPNAQEAPLSYQQFEKYIASQTSSIQKRYGCSKVSFSVALEEDSIRFKAAAENR